MKKLLDKKKKRRRLRTAAFAAHCPFCDERLPAPAVLTQVFSQDGRGGRCACGACFVVDETGRLGGIALLDAQAIACDGDLDRAQKLAPDELEVASAPLAPSGRSFGSPAQRGSPTEPKVWAVRAGAAT